MTVIDPNKPVRVFRNFKHDCYSVLQDGKLKLVAKQVRLVNVEFRIRETGRQRMIRDQRRNVHAFAVGTLVDFAHPSEGRDLDSLSGRSAIYDPHQFNSFVDQETQAPLREASVVQMDERGLFYLAA